MFGWPFELDSFPIPSRVFGFHAVSIAWFQYVLGDYEAMFKSLERGHQVRSPTMVFLLQLKRFLWREVGGDPRYEGLLRRMGILAAG